MIQMDRFSKFYYFGDYSFYAYSSSFLLIYLEELGVDIYSTAILIVSKNRRMLRIVFWDNNQCIQIKKTFKNRLFPISSDNKIRILVLDQVLAIWNGICYRKML